MGRALNLGVVWVWVEPRMTSVLDTEHTFA
jgi:hypothetical protein